LQMNFTELKSLIAEHFTEEELIQLTRELIKIPSHSKVKDREREVALYIHEFCRRVGLESELVPVIDQRMNVIVRLEGTGEGKTLMLNGHTDTVPPYEMDIDPFAAELKDGYIYGRGAVDMKGPIASMLITMLAIKRAGIMLKGDVIFTGVIGEEEKSEGTEAVVKSGLKADGAIVGEPSNYEYAIGHRGLEWLEIEIKGKAAHGGVPELGINAIEKAARLIIEIKEKLYPKLRERFNPKMGPSVMNFGVIRGGNQPSTVADKCIIQIDRRYITGETVDSIIGEYQQIIEDLKAKDPDFHAEIKRMPSNLLLSPEFDHLPLETDAGDPIVISVKNGIKEVIGREPEITKRRGWTDAALLSNYAGIPTVVFGPGDISYSHSRNERVAVKDLVNAVKIYFLAIAQFCGIKGY